MAILGGSIVVLGEVARFGLENARMARDLAHAQLLCESKLAEIATGSDSISPVQNSQLAEGASPGQPAWLYSVETESTDVDSLTSVRVTVTQDLPAENRPAQCTLVRWIVDPSVESQEESESESSSSGSSTSNSGTSQSGTSQSGTSQSESK